MKKNIISIFAVLAAISAMTLSCKPDEVINPDGGVNQEQTPGEGTQTPGEDATTPGEGTQTPGEDPTNPDEGTQTPDEGTQTPDEGTQTPGEDTPTTKTVTVSVDFTSQPFTTDLPTSKKALSNVDFVLSQNEAEYTFTINSPKDKNCILLGKGQGFRMNADGSSNACYVKLPALEGLKLTSVYVKVSNDPGTGKKLYVNTTNDQATAPIMVSVADNDGDANITAVEAQEYTFELSDSSAGTQYWLCSPAKATTFTTWVLTYSE